MIDAQLPISSILPLPADRPSLRAVVFDFDGTLSLLRHGWEGIMTPLMVEMIAGSTAPSVALCAEVEAYIDASAGIQTIHQMVWLADAVQRYGLNPIVHDPWWYKEAYNRRLLQPVNARLTAIALGKQTPDDYLVAGGRALVQALSAAGLSLFVASGTDHPDVVREVAALGLAAYFTEIAGAPPGAMDCSKATVLRRLLTEEGMTGPEVLVVGDGRVEIELGREIGAITLGVATDEAVRQRMNPAKVTRLTQAGAHALVADFTNLPALLAWAGVRP